jgi:release factor glutamine methyltransferase
MPSRSRSVAFGKYRFLVSPDVYFPAEDTVLFANHLSLIQGESVLDMGTGCGFLAILSAERASEVLAVDINPHAIICTRRNVEQNSVDTKVNVLVGDLFDPIRPSIGFDLILFNAPYLPVEANECQAWIEMAWAGGPTGRSVIDRFIDQLSNHLSKVGRVLLMQSTLSNVEKTLTRFRRQGLTSCVIAEEDWFFEKIVLIKACRKNT